MSLLTLTGIRKDYSGVRALAGVDFEVDAGEVHALLGENGAGKSTLMKVVAGAVVPEEGRMELDARELPFGQPERARDRGIGIVYQELSLVPPLSVGENVLLGRWPRGRFRTVDRRALAREAAARLERIGFAVDPRRRVDELGMAERQLVEIAKALSSEVRVLLLDEPTSALSERESQRLFEVIRGLEAGGVGVVYVSHRLSEVLAIADRITVLRDGVRIATVEAAAVDEAHLARLMVGRALESELREAAADTGGGDGQVVLRARGLGRPPRLKPVDLELRAGEIVGVFGLVGAGRTRLARTLFGLEPASEGALEVLGRPVDLRSPAEAIAAGMGYLGEDRAAGIVRRMSVASNVTLASLAAVSRGPVVDRVRERALARRFVDELDIRIASVDQLVETLSGGNQQKVVLARWLATGPRVLLLDEPTKGVDVGAKYEIHGMVRRVAAEGAACLVVSSDLPEILGLADRILVMREGRLRGEITAARATEENVMHLATHEEGEAA